MSFLFSARLDESFMQFLEYEFTEKQSDALIAFALAYFLIFELLIYQDYNTVIYYWIQGIAIGKTAVKCFACDTREFLAKKANGWECGNCMLVNEYRNGLSTPEIHSCSRSDYCQICRENKDKLNNYVRNRKNGNRSLTWRFCSTCLHNQQVIVSLMANYHPPRGQSFEQYRRRILKRHPLSCSSCDQKVDLEIARINSKFKKDIFLERLQISKLQAHESKSSYVNRWQKTIKFILLILEKIVLMSKVTLQVVVIVLCIRSLSDPIHSIPFQITMYFSILPVLLYLLHTIQHGTSFKDAIPFGSLSWQLYLSNVIQRFSIFQIPVTILAISWLFISIVVDMRRLDWAEIYENVRANREYYDAKEEPITPISIVNSLSLN
jgi:hypothetical protein